MLKPYMNRLVAISDMLNSPMQKIREEAYRLLSELWQAYNEDLDFPKEIEQLAKQNPTMLQEIPRQSQAYEAGFSELIAQIAAKAQSEQAKNVVNIKEVDKRFYILTDHPNGADKLNYDQYARALSELVCNPDMRTPITVGIYGQWGKGKTFLMRKIQEEIKKTSTAKTTWKENLHNILLKIQDVIKTRSVSKTKPKENITNVLTIDFNAWSYSTSENLWAGMVTNLYNEVEKYFGWKVPWYRFSKAVRKSWLRALSLTFFYVVLGFAFSALFDYDHLIGSWNNFQEAVKTIGASIIGGSAIVASFPILWSAIKDFTDTLFLSRAKNLQNMASRPDFREQIGIMADIKNEINFISGILKKKPTRLVLFIDDLDRCDHKKAVEVLQSIMLLLSDEDGAPFVIFLGIDARVMVHAIEENYGDVLVKAGITGYEYLDKIIQLPFSIPYTDPKELRNYVEALLWASDDEKKSVEEKQSTETSGAQATNTEIPVQPADKPSEPDVKIPVTFSKDEREAILNCAGDFCDNPRKIKRIINMYRLAKLLTPETMHDKEKIIRWILMTEQWPLHTAWIIHSVEDDLQLKQVVPETPIKDVYNKVKELMHSDEMGKIFSIDYDPTLFDVFLEKEPQFTILDVLNLLPTMFYLNPAIQWEVNSFANRKAEDINKNIVSTKPAASAGTSRRSKTGEKSSKTHSRQKSMPKSEQ